MNKFDELYESVIMLTEMTVKKPTKIANSTLIKEIFFKSYKTENTAKSKLQSLIGKDVKIEGDTIYHVVGSKEYFLNFTDIPSANISIIDIELNYKNLGSVILDTDSAYKDLDDRDAYNKTR